MNNDAINIEKAYVKGQWVFWSFNILYHFYQLCKLYGPNLNFWVQLIQNTVVSKITPILWLQ